MRLRSLAVALAIGAGVAQAGHAAVLYTTDFNAPTYTDGALNTNTDTTTAGQAGWLNTSGGGTNNISVSNTATNGIVTLTTSGQDVRHPLSGAVTSGSVYLDVDFRLSAAQATGDYFMSLGDGGASNFYNRIYAKSATGGFVMSLVTGSGTPVYSSTVLALDTTYHLLTRYDFVAGATNDTGAMWINPTTADGGGDTPYANITTAGTDPTSISAVYLRQGNASNAATVSLIDNIVVNGNVPEPTSALVLSVGGLLLAGRRRRTI